MNFNIKNRLIQVVIHVMAWGVFLALLSTLVPRPQIRNSVLPVLVPFLFFATFFYLNFYVLVPRFFIPKKYISYLLICLTYLVLTIAIPSLITELSRPEMSFPGEKIGPESGQVQGSRPGNGEAPPILRKPDDPGRDTPGMRGAHPPPVSRLDFFRPEFSYSVLVFFLMLTLSTGIRIIMEWQQAEKEKVNAELAFLKAQINPHFLFNTLNTIYSLAVSKAEKTPYAIEKFSDMMRFVIRDACNDYVPLSRKIEYIDTFIALQKLRLPPSAGVNYQVTGNPGASEIAPMILMPFIENAFKYGISTEKKSVITINIGIEENKLDLTVKNSKFAAKNIANGATHLGVENTKKRLELIYPGKHKLEISESESEYYVHLNLHLK